MLQHIWFIRANSCQRLILQLFVRVGSSLWGFFAGSKYLLLQQVSFLGQVFNLSKGVPHRGKVFCLFSSSSFLFLRIPLVSSPNMHLLYLWLLLRSYFFRSCMLMTLLQCHLDSKFLNPSVKVSFKMVVSQKLCLCIPPFPSCNIH